jgi:prepilin-type N-terminal cleavage/methylation domain-containing protein
MQTRAHGFTLIEVTIALTLLVTVLAASWTVLSGAQRNERLLWDEFLASELAVSQLERTTAAKSCVLTPPAGTVLEISDAHPDLADLKVTLIATAVDQRSDLVEIRVIVAWTEATMHATSSLERSTRMRTSR